MLECAYIMQDVKFTHIPTLFHLSTELLCTSEPRGLWSADDLFTKCVCVCVYVCVCVCVCVCVGGGCLLKKLHIILKLLTFPASAIKRFYFQHVHNTMPQSNTNITLGCNLRASLFCMEHFTNHSALNKRGKNWLFFLTAVCYEQYFKLGSFHKTSVQQKVLLPKLCHV